MMERERERETDREERDDMPKTALKLETRSIHNLLQIERNAVYHSYEEALIGMYR